MNDVYSDHSKYEKELNSLVSRYRKFLVAAAFGFVGIANVWANGPEWVYIAAPVVASVLVALVGNAPKYTDPRHNR